MKNKKERDWKFIIGMIVLLAIFAVMGGAFWNMVGKQAQMVREEEQKEEQMLFLQSISRQENF